MAQFQEFAITEGAPVQVNAFDDVVAGQVQDDEGDIISDLTGDAALHFPAVLATLTADQRRVILDDMGVGQYLLKVKAGLL
jgi:hypothetical protein